MKCEVSKQDIETTFLDKLRGTVVKDKKGKKHFVSAAVQAQFKNDKEAILNALK